MREEAQESPDEVTTKEEKPSPAKRARGEVPQQDGFLLETLSSGTQFPSVPVQSNRNAVLLGVAKPISCGVLVQGSLGFTPGALHTKNSPHPKEQKVATKAVKKGSKAGTRGRPRKSRIRDSLPQVCQQPQPKKDPGAPTLMEHWITSQPPEQSGAPKVSPTMEHRRTNKRPADTKGPKPTTPATTSVPLPVKLQNCTTEDQCRKLENPSDIGNEDSKDTPVEVKSPKSDGPGQGEKSKVASTSITHVNPDCITPQTAKFEFGSTDMRTRQAALGVEEWKGLMATMRESKVFKPTSKGRKSSAQAKVQAGSPKHQVIARSRRLGGERKAKTTENGAKGLQVDSQGRLKGLETRSSCDPEAVEGNSQLVP